MSRFWIVDGHNVIFAVVELKRLQVTEHREEARQGLLDALRRFARTKNDHLLVVFDGGDGDLQGNEDVVRDHLLEVVYARRSQGGADERIIREAKSLRQRGHSVTVVTNDVITLAAELPKDIDHLKVRPFWQKYIEAPEGDANKRVEGDFSEMEKEMLARAAAAEPEVEAYSRRPSAQASAGPLSEGASGKRGRDAGKDALRERLRLKKERGKARHQRRFKRS